MFLRQSVLFAVVLLWNLAESALDNDNKTIAHDNSSSSRLNENPLAGHALLELQEPAPVNDTNRVDQLNEVRSPSAFMSKVRPTHPEDKLKTLGLDNYVKRQLDDKTSAILRLWVMDAREYIEPGARERWYTTEKVFLLLVKTRPIHSVLCLLWNGSNRPEAVILRGMLAGPGFSALRQKMNKQWLDLGVDPETVFWLLDIDNKSFVDDLKIPHWILYSIQFALRYAGRHFSVEGIVKYLLAKEILDDPLLYGVYFQQVAQLDPTLKPLIDEMEEKLYEWLIRKTKTSPLSAYHTLLPFAKDGWLKREEKDELFRTLKGFTKTYLYITGNKEFWDNGLDQLTPETIFSFLDLSARLPWRDKKSK